MKSWKEIGLDALGTGKLASIATAATMFLCGKIESGHSAAAVNAISHMAFGEKAAKQNAASLKYTGTGLLLNDAACTSWAALHEQLFGRKIEKGNRSLAFTGGLAVSALAYIADYYLAPKRFTPGMEKRLSSRSLFLLYAVLALSLGLGSLLNARKKSSE